MDDRGGNGAVRFTIIRVLPAHIDCVVVASGFQRVKLLVSKNGKKLRRIIKIKKTKQKVTGCPSAADVRRRYAA